MNYFSFSLFFSIVSCSFKSRRNFFSDQVCGDSDSSKGKISDGERGDKTSHFEVDKSSRHRPIVTTPNQNEPWDKNVTSPVNKVSANGSTSASPKTRKYNNLNATLPVKDDRGENGPNVNESRANGKKESNEEVRNKEWEKARNKATSKQTDNERKK